jgi:hypothetical protein
VTSCCFLIGQEAVEKGACREVNKASEEPKKEKQSPVTLSHCLSLPGFREHLGAPLAHWQVIHIHNDTLHPPSVRLSCGLRPWCQ